MSSSSSDAPDSLRVVLLLALLLATERAVEPLHEASVDNHVLGRVLLALQRRAQDEVCRKVCSPGKQELVGCRIAQHKHLVLVAAKEVDHATRL